RVSAARMSFAWLHGGVQMSTKSSGASASKRSALSYQRLAGRCRARAACRAGSASVAATIPTSRRMSQPGNGPGSATLPRPMIAPRSIVEVRSGEAVRAAGRFEGLVEHGEAGERGLLADGERRIDADRGRVRHGHEPASQALLEQRPREVLRDGLLALR